MKDSLAQGYCYEVSIDGEIAIIPVLMKHAATYCYRQLWRAERKAAELKAEYEAWKAAKATGVAFGDWD